jgi:hypothetical protein
VIGLLKGLFNQVPLYINRFTGHFIRMIACVRAGENPYSGIFGEAEIEN